MTWSIAEVARMSKVTSRTLRHYDDIGLVPRAYVGSNGYRYYEQEQLLRLQQVLLLRELGLGLGAIAEILDGERDAVAALRRHEQWLREESGRLGRLADTVGRTITHMSEGMTMPAEELFEGFPEQQARHEAVLVERYGDGVRQHFHTSRERTQDWTKQDYLHARREAEVLDERVAQLMREGRPVDSADVLEAMAEHHAWVAHFWTPDAESYRGLGQLYVDDPQFYARYEACAPGLAEYLRDATAAYAEQRLS